MRNKVLTIAGFDPSGGAGILADIKTFEAHKVYGFGICSALTYQNQEEFDGVEWIAIDKMICQLEVLKRKNSFAFAKIGLIEDLKVLNTIVNKLNEYDVKVVWDPVIKASAGYVFHQNWSKKQLLHLLQNLFLLTPNFEEAKMIADVLQINLKNLNDYIAANNLAAFYIKSFGSEKGIITDILYNGKMESVFQQDLLQGYDKHGTGCMLSSAITANLSKGVEVAYACGNAQQFVYDIKQSNDSKLSYINI
jgi:hydroxymethylpyrimidine/phosphomethylpyrimidine kinase